jgi:hypothetical protein
MAVLRFAFVFVLWWIVSPAFAQEKLPFENLSIDRPDISNLPVTVHPGHYQVELGFEYAENKHTSAWNIPNFILRTGLGRKTELRIGTSLTHLDSNFVNLSNRISSGSISIKHRIVEEKGWIPSIGIQPELNYIHTKATEQGDPSHDITYDLLVLFNNAFHEQIFLNYNIGWIHLTENEQRWLLSASLSFQHTHRLGYFVEAYTIRTWEERRNISYDAGITFLVNPRFQADIYAGKLWTAESSIKYIGVGVGFRLDKGDMKHKTFKEIGIHH